MTEPQGVRGLEREPLSQRTARRIRGAIAENRIRQSALARALHLPQQTLSRKVNGTTAFTLDELELVADVLGVSLEAVQGIGEYADRSIGRVTLTNEGPPTAGGGTFFLPSRRPLCASRDLNPEPADSRSVAAAVVLPFKRPFTLASTHQVTTDTTPVSPRHARLRLVVDGEAS